MRFITLRVERFKSFKDATIFDFPEGPGLFFLRGENLAEPRLDANGAGKSTLWDALTWLFFDKTVKGLRAGDVATWGVSAKESTEVSLTFELDGGLYTIVRTWRPNTWRLFDHYEGITDADWNEWVDLAKDPGNPVLGRLRLNFQAWLNAVVISSREPMFLDLKPEPKAALFSSILDLDRWLDLSQRASTKASEADRQARRLESDLAHLEGRLRALQEQGDTEEQASAWEASHKAEITRVVEAYDEAIKQEKWAALNRREAAASFRDAKAAHQKVRDELVALEAHAKQIIKQINSGTCPTCGQRVTPADAQKHHEAELRVLEPKVASLARSLKNAEADLRSADDDDRHAEDQLRKVERLLDDLARDADRLSKETNPYRAEADRVARERKRLSAELEAARDELDEMLSRQRLYATWVTGFKEVRLLQIAEALQQLEIEVNSRCVELGLVGWALRFAVDRESKRGAISRGFTVMVESPSNKDPVPFEAWSGGESQRLRQAAQMGLIDLMRARMGLPAGLPEVWDEPTEGLSPVGVTDLLNCLSARAVAEGRQIWVVDHHSLGYGAFDGVFTVTKTRGGSVISAT